MIERSTSELSESEETIEDWPSSSKVRATSISLELQETLQHIVDDVVKSLGCVGAMVATMEPNNTLPVRAYSVAIAPGLVKQWEKRLGVGFVGPKSVSYLDNKKFKEYASLF